MSDTRVRSDKYKAAGVDIDLATELLGKVKKKLAVAKRPEMLAPIGGFGGLFRLEPGKYRDPVLVSSIDGVGTKLMVAAMANNHRDVGRDIVNHCVNDIAVQGAEPLYFLDYIGIGKLRSPLYEEVLSGMADACVEAGCALLGGETAEMPGMYGNDFDLVGVITGVVERDRLITGEKIRPGHVAVGLASNGLHTNGYSLARKILFADKKYKVDQHFEELGETLGDALLKPHTCYWPAIKKALDAGLALDGIAHITGGGLYDNTPRIMPPDIDVIFKKDALPVPPVLRLITREGGVSDEEAYRVFNMGVGMVWFLPPSDVPKALEACRSAGRKAAVCGEVVAGTKKVFVK